MHQQMITLMGRYGVDDQQDQVPTHFSVKPTKKSALHEQCCCVIVVNKFGTWHVFCGHFQYYI